MDKCRRCEGKGKIPSFFGRLGGETCGDCGGTGRVPGLAGPAPAAVCGTDTYIVTVKPNRTIEEMVTAGGYDYADGSVNDANFPDPPRWTGEVRTELVHFGEWLETPDVEARLSERALEPADLHELLAFGGKYSDVQRRFLVVALGSSWVGPDGVRRVPYLYGNSGDRSLDLYWDDPGGRWHVDDRFLAVRK